MALSGPALADAIRSTMGFPLPVSTYLNGWGNGIVNEITTNAQVSNASGTVTGTAPSIGGPLSAGAATGGTISNLNGSRLASTVASDAGYPFVSGNLSAMCGAIVTHIESVGLVSFSSGNITGTCTNDATHPGTLSGGAGTGGTVSGLNGSTLASAIASAVGYPFVSSQLINFSTAIVNYIMTNAQVSYASGQVTATCPANGGSISLGAATSGTIA